jgi:hypothetical protein
VSHPVARGAERACAVGDAKYVPKMITGSCAAVVAWAALRPQFRRTEIQQTALRHARAGHRVERRMRQPEQRSSVKSRGRWLLRGLAAIGHEVRAPAIATRITLRDHIAPVRQHADGSICAQI